MFEILIDGYEGERMVWLMIKHKHSGKYEDEATVLLVDWEDPDAHEVLTDAAKFLYVQQGGVA